MILSIMRYAAILLASVLLHGCAWYVYDATNRSIASHIVGRCFALRENGVLSGYAGYSLVYMLNLAGANECTPQGIVPTTKDEERYNFSGLHYPKCIWVPVANVAKDTTFRVTAVTEDLRGGQWTKGGIVRCWKVDITFISGPHAGIRTGIPACRFDFPESELWVRMKSEHDYVEPLELSDRVAKPCEE